MQIEVATQLARLAWGRKIGPSNVYDARRIGAALTGVLDRSVVEDWLAAVDHGAVHRPLDGPIEQVQAMVDDQRRRRRGIYLSPRPVAEAMATAVDGHPNEAIVDLSAGAGTLLEAVIRGRPHLRAVGVELDAALAVAAAINLVGTRLRAGQAHDRDRIYVGDGLSARAPWSDLERRAAAVVGNPPYVREKGNRQFFRRLEAKHGHLAEFFGARMDLLYLFFHRGASFVRPGGRLVYLTSTYWLTATHARTLRQDLSQRLTPRGLLRVQQGGVFAHAPGQHSLISVFGRPSGAGDDAASDDAASDDTASMVRALSCAQRPDNWKAAVEAVTSGGDDPDGSRPDRSRPDNLRQVRPDSLDSGLWTPFVDADTVGWGARLERAGTPLGELVDDRQGFVSGADRATRRHAKFYDDGAELPAVGEPIFIFEDTDLPAELRALGSTVVRPLLRASQLDADAVYVVAPAHGRVLYVDGPVSPAHEAILEAHLGRFRPVLERRREVRRGSMPWYRLHWPRERRQQTGPKLAVPRRAPKPCFALDLSASNVSSDCTYLVAPPDCSAPVRYLLELMVVLNHSVVRRYLRHFGKSKGPQIEFYSDPLRSLPMPFRRDESGNLAWIDGAVDTAIRNHCRRRIDALWSRINCGPE